MKTRVMCNGCGKETTNPYSRRGTDGIERRYCRACASKEIQKMQDKERLARWNEWAKA